MRKNFLLILTLLFCVVSASAQKKITGDFFSITTPNSSWLGGDSPREDGQAVGLYTAKNDVLDAGVVIVVMEGVYDYEDYLSFQCEADNPIYQGGKFTPVKKNKFKGYDSAFVDFTNTMDGQKYSGSLATFATAESTYFVILYSIDNDPAQFEALLKGFVIHK